MTFRSLLLLAVVVVTQQGMSAENWPQWRGPTANGVAAGKAYPTKWSDKENVLWKAKMPGIGASTPVIWEDNIIVTSEIKGNNGVVCFDRSGNKKWEASLSKEIQARNRKASGCNPSPVTDGKHIFVYYKSGELACVTMEGKVVWKKNLQDEYGEDTLWWDLGTSPVLTKDHVIVACMQTGPSYVAAFDKATGKEAWKVSRDVEAPGESAQSYTTPLVVGEGDAQRVIILGADHVTAHDAKTGKQIWIAGGLNPQGQRNWRSISSPVVIDDTIVAPYGRGRVLSAFRMGGTGDVTKSHLAWSVDGPAADVPCPVAHDGKIYICGDRGQVAVLDGKSGETIASLRLSGRNTMSASPVLAGGHLYVTSEGGTTSVLKLNEKKLEVVSQNNLGVFLVATPVFADGKIYIRADDHLYCIGK